MYGMNTPNPNLGQGRKKDMGGSKGSGGADSGSSESYRQKRRGYSAKGSKGNYKPCCK